MLENYYFIAGIVVAIVAVIGLFIRSQKGKTVNKQQSKITGSNNSVTQHVGAEREDKK